MWLLSAVQRGCWVALIMEFHRFFTDQNRNCSLCHFFLAMGCLAQPTKAFLEIIMRLFTFAFLLGVCGMLLFSILPNMFLVAGILVFALILHFKIRRTWSLLVFACVLGLCWSLFFSYLQMNKQLPKLQESKRLQVVGYVVSLPEKTENSVKFLFKTIKMDGHKHKRLLKLNWYHSHINLQAGDQWRLVVKLKRPHGFMNPGGFDYEAWLFQQGISATGYVVVNNDNQFISEHWYYSPINYLRQKLQNKINALFPNQPLAGFLPALLIGSRQAITQDQWQVLRRTGTNHLIAIAGLHIGLVAGLIFFLIRWVWRLFPALCLRMPMQQAAALLSLMGAAFYSLLAGFPIQTQRALIMLTIVLGAVVFKRRIAVWHSYCLALFLVLLLNPFNIISVGFWMSFVTVFVIIFSLSVRINSESMMQKIWREWGRMQWIIALGVAPLSLYFFHETSFVGLLANVIAVPWFGFIIVPLCFFGVVFLFLNASVSHLFLWCALKNLQWLWVILKALSHLPVMTWQHNISNVWILIFVMLAVFLILLPKGFPARYLFFVFLLPFFTSHDDRPAYGTAFVTLLDVGQGLSSVVQTKNHVLIFDTGAKFSETFDAGDAVLIPYFQAKNIRAIDKMIISHGDNDHIGGARSVLNAMPVKAILTSVPNRFKNYSANYCHRGQSWNWDGVKFEMLSPRIGHYDEDNNSSCVLRVSVGNKHVLFTGDIEKPVESELIKHELKQLPETILIAPHHGSVTSSSWKFVQAAHPKVVLFPVGYLNRFHFPSRIVMQRYQKIGAKEYDTVSYGAITFHLNGKANDLMPMLYRKQHKHLWGSEDGCWKIEGG